MRILFCENDPGFLAIRSVYLEDAGHQVIPATTPAAAEAALRTLHVHLAIMDVRLEDDNDGADASGLALITHPDFREIPKIVLTSYPNLAQLRDSLLADAELRPGAWDYLDKRQPVEDMLGIIEKVLRERVRINRDLRIHCPDSISLAHLANLLAPRDMAPLALARYADPVGELEDLFRAVFFDFEQITIQQMLWHRDGRVALTVLAYAPRGHAGRDAEFIVTCGAAEAIRAEAEAYSQAAPAALTQGKGAITSGCTVHFGLNAYEATGDELEDARPLNVFFAGAPQRAIADALEALCETALKPGRERASLKAPANLRIALADCLSEQPETLAPRLEERLEALADEAQELGLATIEVFSDQVRLALPRLKAETLPNPVVCLTAPALNEGHTAVKYGTRLVALDARALLVGTRGRAWLTDYAALRGGPLVADYAALETLVKFELADCADPLERYEMEKALLEPAQLNARLDPSVPAALDKVVAAVRKVRHLAAAEWGLDAAPYYAALFATTTEWLLNANPAIRHTRKEVVALIHAATSLGLLCKRLLTPQTDARPLADAGLRIDANARAVTVGGKLVSLTPTEYALLSYLWNRPNQVCEREELQRAVFEGAASKAADDNLNSVMNRIRAKIEADTRHPAYLLVRRGHGVLLCPAGAEQPAPE